MLSLEQCKKLRDWGLPQELKWGNWYWYDIPGLVGYTQELYGPDDRTYPATGEYYKIPTLDELMGFALGLDDHWMIAPISGGWGISSNKFSTICEESPIEAVYKLIKRAMDVSDGRPTVER